MDRFSSADETTLDLRITNVGTEVPAPAPIGYSDSVSDTNAGPQCPIPMLAKGLPHDPATATRTCWTTNAKLSSLSSTGLRTYRAHDFPKSADVPHSTDAYG